MSRQQRIQSKLTATFNPVHLEVSDESHMHSVPEGSESHFKVLVVSEIFREMKRIDRQRRINALLADEFNSGLHALSLHTWSPEEWFEKGGQAPDSPPCLGGSKAS
jgi:BolA protein